MTRLYIFSFAGMERGGGAGLMVVLGWDEDTLEDHAVFGMYSTYYTRVSDCFHRTLGDVARCKHVHVTKYLGHSASAQRDTTD